MRRMVWVWLLAAGMLSWAIGAGQAGEIALVTDRAGQVTATVGSGSSWAPQVGETLPEGAFIRVPAGGFLRLFHLGMNQEVTLPENAEATLQAGDLVASPAYEPGAVMAGLPGPLSLEAASQQQLGAVNLQRMDTPTPPPPPTRRPAAVPADVEMPEATREEPSPELPPDTGNSGMIMPEPTQGSSGTDHQAGGSPQGSASEEGSDGLAPPSSLPEPAGGGESADQSQSAGPRPAGAAQGMAASPKEREIKAVSAPVRLALPRFLLPPGLPLGSGLPMHAGGKTLPPLAVIAEHAAGSHSWVILTGTVPPSAGPATVSIPLVPPRRLEDSVDPTAGSGTGPVMTALRLEATGCRAQAAAVWVDLAQAGTVSREIAGRHLDRLAAALARTGN